MKSHRVPHEFDDGYPGGNSPEFVGTGTGAMPDVLRSSDAAKIVECPECGYHDGRHSLRCPNRNEGKTC